MGGSWGRSLWMEKFLSRDRRLSLDTLSMKCLVGIQLEKPSWC